MRISGQQQDFKRGCQTNTEPDDRLLDGGASAFPSSDGTRAQQRGAKPRPHRVGLFFQSEIWAAIRPHRRSARIAMSMKTMPRSAPGFPAAHGAVTSNPAETRESKCLNRGWPCYFFTFVQGAMLSSNSPKDPWPPAFTPRCRQFDHRNPGLRIATPPPWVLVAVRIKRRRARPSNARPARKDDRALGGSPFSALCTLPRSSPANGRGRRVL